MRWGIIGTGWIAETFARDLTFLDDHKVIAVGSRTLAKAQSFAGEHGIPHSYASYEELVNHTDIDGVYIATPHPFHCENTLLALNAGKPVLCEKPFAISARESRMMVAKAREKNLLLMEAMWTRFLPHIHQVRAVLAAGEIGDVISVEADHGQWFEFDPKFRLFAPELGGGALLDLGIYPISFSYMVLGKPDRITARGVMAATGVDAQTSAIFDYASGAQAIVTTTLQAATPCKAVINGSKGRIEIDRTFYTPTSFRVTTHKGGTEKITEYPNDYQGHGLREQAVEFARALKAGEIQSPLLPHDETISIMATLDEIRSQIGLRYSFEPLSAN